MNGSNGIRGIIFDLDGTLIDSFEAIREGFNATLPFYGMEPLSLKETMALIGTPLTETLADLLGPENAIEATRLFRVRYREIYLKLTTPLPHASEAIRSLHRKGYRLGVATNKHAGFSRDIVRHFKWDDALTSVVGEGDTEKSKPEPDMILKNLEEMAVGNNEVLFIGDSVIDVETGNNAGVKTIGVLTGQHSREKLMKAGAALIISDLSELEGIMS